MAHHDDNVSDIPQEITTPGLFNAHPASVATLAELSLRLHDLTDSYMAGVAGIETHLAHMDFALEVQDTVPFERTPPQEGFSDNETSDETVHSYRERYLAYEQINGQWYITVRHYRVEVTNDRETRYLLFSEPLREATHALCVASASRMAAFLQQCVKVTEEAMGAVQQAFSR